MEKEPLTDTFCMLRDKLHSVAGRLLKDEIEAEDAVQDTFCNLWAADSPASANEARYKMFAVLKNVCINKLRRKRPQSGIELPEIAVEPAADVDPDGLRKELFEHLTPMQKKVFSLSLDEDMEYEEIAETLGLSIEAVRMHMCRARKILREQYKKLDR
ncbi:MAG: sigma-70 family RNA polymerase sigma factor [Muribaculaceae bacterium]|nr:sigma-70 family RNA polymerase sigma factor [Muribaculaceae bacterium]